MTPVLGRTIRIVGVAIFVAGAVTLGLLLCVIGAPHGFAAIPKAWPFVVEFGGVTATGRWLWIVGTRTNSN